MRFKLFQTLTYRKAGSIPAAPQHNTLALKLFIGKQACEGQIYHLGMIGSFF